MTFDPSRTFLRLVASRPDGFVELELAVGDPELFVELILTRAAFDELCARDAVTRLPPRELDAAKLDHDRAPWTARLREAAHHRLDEPTSPSPPEPACTSTSAP